MTPRQQGLGIASAVAVLCIWSSFILIARSSARLNLAAGDLAFLRFAFSGLLVLPLLAWRRARGRPALGGLGARQVAALAGTAGIGYCLLAYSGFFYAPVAHAAVLLPGSLPLWTALIAVWALQERPGRTRLFGLALIVAGDLLVGSASLRLSFEGGEAWKGDLLFIGASILWAAYTVLCRRWRVGAVDATLAIALGCLLAYVPLYAGLAAAGVLPSRLALAPWGEIAFQAVYQGGLAMLVSGVAYTQVVATFGPLRSVMITALVPGISALAAVPLLGEPLGPATLIGLVAVSAGLLVGLRTPAAPALRAAA